MCDVRACIRVCVYVHVHTGDIKIFRIGTWLLDMISTSGGSFQVPAAKICTKIRQTRFKKNFHPPLYSISFHSCWLSTKALCSMMVVSFVFQLFTHIIIFWAEVKQQYGCTNPRGGELKAVQLGFEDRHVTTQLIGGLEAHKIVDNCSCHTIFKRTGMNYHSMTVQSNSLSRGAEANASRNQERAHQKAPIWAVRYRDEQWANPSALC